MSYFRICSMRSIQKTTFCGFIALLNKVLDFGGQLADKSGGDKGDKFTVLFILQIPVL